MTNVQVYNYHLKNGNRLLAAVVAVQIARDEETQEGRSKWLQKAIDLQPVWLHSALFADRFNDWTRLDAQIAVDLNAAGLTNQDAWKFKLLIAQISTWKEFLRWIVERRRN